MKQDIIVGLDFGSSAIRIAVGQETESNDRNLIHIIGAVEVPSEGIHRGVVTSIDDAVSSLSNCIERAEHIIGAPIEKAIVGITGSHISSQPSKGVIGVSRQDGEITEDEVERAIEAARNVPIPSNHEILHVIPRGFTIDGQTGIKDPVGMTGIRLEVETEIIQGISTQVKNITKSIYRTGIDIEDIVFSILATSEAVVNARQKEIGVLVVSIGASTTSIIVFEEGDVLHTGVISIGSEHITSDLAIGLRTSIDVAERVKIEAGTSLPEDVGKKEEIDLRDFGGLENELVSRKYVADIIEARVEEIFDKINGHLKGINRSGLLPGGVVLTGGGSKMPGVVEVAKRRLKLPALLGYPLSITGVTDKINDLSFTTAVGLVLWGGSIRTHHKGIMDSITSPFASADKVVKNIKKWFGSIMP